MAKAVIIELDRKGYYSRYALTPEEFKTEYQEKDPDIPDPTETGDSYTTRPLVHIWYKLVDIDCDLWNTFFTDMSWELPQSDIDNNNLATVALNECLSLCNTVSDTIYNQKGD